MPMRVWPSDIDLNIHMNNGRYLSLMDLGRLDLMVRTGMWKAVARQGWRPMIGSATVRFRRPLPLFARFDLRSAVVCWDAKWFFMEQRFIRDGLAYGVGLVKGLFRMGDRNVPPAEVLAAIGRLQLSPPPPPGISDWLAAEGKLAQNVRNHKHRR